ncbi:thioesterase family protein [Inquilinus sp. CAU 1745]|uniref:thioesterase family protein n=1 Tax=Inquilinus sp. CAU 1745 TaxID=3140369 RepID=UPI00325BDFEB
MNLIVRLIKTLVLAFLARRIDLLDRSSVSFRVWPNDLDFNLHMNNGRYLTLMDLGRTDLMIRSGFARVAFARRWMPVLAGATIRYRRSLAPFQRFQLESRLVGWDDKWLYLEQRFETMDGKSAASAMVRAVFLGGGHTIPTAEIIAAADISPTSPALPPDFAAWIAAEDGGREVMP